MPTNRVWKGRKPAQSELSEGARRFLLGFGADAEDYEGLALFQWNELAILSMPSREDETQGKLTGCSGLTARELVRRYGREYLAIFESKQPAEKPDWYDRIGHEVR